MAAEGIVPVDPSDYVPGPIEVCSRSCVLLAVFQIVEIAVVINARWDGKYGSEHWLVLFRLLLVFLSSQSGLYGPCLDCLAMQ